MCAPFGVGQAAVDKKSSRRKKRMEEEIIGDCESVCDVRERNTCRILGQKSQRIRLPSHCRRAMAMNRAQDEMV